MGKRYPQRFKEIIKRYWKSRNEDEMLFLTASSTSSAEQDKLPKAHFHNTFTMSALEGGALPLSFKDHSVVLHPGEILIIGRKIPHMVEPIYKDEACNYRSITINKELLGDDLLTKIKHSENSVSKICDEKIWRDFLREQQYMENGETKGINEIRDISEKILSEIEDNILFRFQIKSPYIRTLIDYIEENYLSSPGIEELAGIVNLSSYYLTRLFKQEIGMSPHAYINQLRINRAGDLIQQGESLLGIAYELGFADQSHFSKTFLKLTGMSPIRFNQVLKTN